MSKHQEQIEQLIQEGMRPLREMIKAIQREAHSPVNQEKIRVLRECDQEIVIELNNLKSKSDLNSKDVVSAFEKCLNIFRECANELDFNKIG